MEAQIDLLVEKWITMYCASYMMNRSVQSLAYRQKLRKLEAQKWSRQYSHYRVEHAATMRAFNKLLKHGALRCEVVQVFEALRDLCDAVEYTEDVVRDVYKLLFRLWDCNRRFNTADFKAERFPEATIIYLSTFKNVVPENLENMRFMLTVLTNSMDLHGFWETAYSVARILERIDSAVPHYYGVL